MSDQETYNEEAARTFAKALFARDEPHEPGEQQKPPGYVAREGNISEPPHVDQDMRAFTRELFDRDPA